MRTWSGQCGARPRLDWTDSGNFVDVGVTDVRRTGVAVIVSDNGIICHQGGKDRKAQTSPSPLPRRLPAVTTDRGNRKVFLPFHTKLHCHARKKQALARK
jgi:hypothetical protein